MAGARAGPTVLSQFQQKTTSLSTPPLRQAVGVGDLAEWFGLCPLFGWCLRKLGQTQPPSCVLLLVESGVGLLARLLAQLRRLAAGSLKHPLDLSLLPQRLT